MNDTTSFFVHVKFSDELLISQHEKHLDSLLFVVLRAEAFVASDGKEASSPVTSLKIEVPNVAVPDFV